MPRVESKNNRILCAAPVSVAPTKTTGPGGFLDIAEKVQLVPLTVVFRNEHYGVGDIVHVSGESISAPWYKRPFKALGVKVVMVPEECIILAEHKE